MRLRNTLVAATLLGLPTAALAQPVNGFYVGAGAGYNYLQDQNAKMLSAGRATASLSNVTLRGFGGPVGSISAGYGFGNGFRVELQGDFRYDRQKLAGSTRGVSGRADNETYGGFVNALYDFDVGTGFVFPYLGVGIGYEGTTLTGIKGSVPGLGSASLGSASASSVAAQAILGAAFPIPAVPGLSATLEYRFMATLQNEKFKSSIGGVPVSAKVGSQYNDSALLGLRYAFNVAPPPPPPAPAPVAAPAPAPARTYLVFFDWDKADLTARARQVIAEAAANVARVQVTRIEVNGYTDTSGTAKYNQKLSVRRAESVAAELVRDGVAKNEIAIKGFGETHLLVPTGPGVREPQNRRVEIILK